jgi:hypothetical protein
MKQSIAGRFTAFAGGLLALIALISCASVPAPEWYRNTDAVYPQDRFIAYQGRGRDRAGAENAALGAIAGYFESEVIDITRTAARWTNGQEESLTETSTIVASQVRLLAVRYTEDAWRDRATGEYVTVAYIDREEAWKAYSLHARNAANALLTFFQKAEEESDPFTRALRFSEADRYAAGTEFSAARGFAQTLYPARAAALFGEADAARSALPERIATARRNASVYLDCPLDLDGLVRNAAAAAFEAAGFPVANERRGAAVCVIRVNEGPMTRPAGTFYYPELSGAVRSRNGAAVFTFTAKAESQAARDPALARRRAYTALAQAVRDALPGQLDNWGRNGE